MCKYRHNYPNGATYLPKCLPFQNKTIYLQHEEVHSYCSGAACLDCCHSCAWQRDYHRRQDDAGVRRALF